MSNWGSCHKYTFMQKVHAMHSPHCSTEYARPSAWVHFQRAASNTQTMHCYQFACMHKGGSFTNRQTNTFYQLIDLILIVDHCIGKLSTKIYESLCIENYDTVQNFLFNIRHYITHRSLKTNQIPNNPLAHSFNDFGHYRQFDCIKLSPITDN